MTVRIIQADCRDAMRELCDIECARVHSCVTDPPYLLESIKKRFGKSEAAPAKGGDGRFSRLSGGFMGQQWDGRDSDGYAIVEDPAMWRLVYDLLLPGGFLLAFSSPRTGHRMATAIENAGFVIHPFIGWGYGQGFPKGHSVVKAAPEAEEWVGWFYGSQTLKPALEPIYVAQKPFSGKGFENVLEHGVGAFNIDACRVEFIGDDGRWGEGTRPGGFAEVGAPKGGSEPNGRKHPAGRWPANLVHDGSPEVLAAFPTTESGTGAVKRRSSRDRTGNTGATYGAESRSEGTPMVCYGDRGSAARFFNAFPPDEPRIGYFSKAMKADRGGSNHPTVKPLALMRWLVRLVTPPGGIVLDPFAGSGTTGQAAAEEGMRTVLIEQDATYVADIRRRMAEKPTAGLNETPSRASSQSRTDVFDLLGPPEGLRPADTRPQSLHTDIASLIG